MRGLPILGEFSKDLFSGGQTYYELQQGFSIPKYKKDLKIIALKFYKDWDAFMIKRINGVVELFHHYNYIFRLLEEDLRKLADLKMINHHNRNRGTKFEMILLKSTHAKKLDRDKIFWDANFTDNNYWFPRKERKKRKLSEKERKEDDMEDYERGMRFPCKNLEIDLVTKSISRTKDSLPITSCSYDQRTFELVIRRWKAEQQAEKIRLFSTVELKLLHPSYIKVLDKSKFPEVRN